MQADIIQTLMGAISSLAFAILFGVRNRKALISIVIGSAIGWAAYIVSTPVTEKPSACWPLG